MHQLYDLLFDTTCTLLSRFMKPIIVGKYTRAVISKADVRIAVNNSTIPKR